MLQMFKDLAVTEDLSLGFGDVTQTRDVGGVPTQKTYKKISAETLPAGLRMVQRVQFKLH